MVQALIFALCFLGLLAGVIISSFTKEELKSGRKYFVLLQRFILLAISFVIVFYIMDYFFFLVLGFLAGIVLRRVYFYLGLAFPLASGNFLVLLSSLIFLYGLPRGSFIYSMFKSKKNLRKEMVLSAVFFIAGVLISSFFSYGPLLMFCSGALLANICVGYFKR